MISASFCRRLTYGSQIGTYKICDIFKLADKLSKRTKIWPRGK